VVELNGRGVEIPSLKTETQGGAATHGISQA